MDIFLKTQLFLPNVSPLQVPPPPPPCKHSTGRDEGQTWLVPCDCGLAEDLEPLQRRTVAEAHRGTHLRMGPGQGGGRLADGVRRRLGQADVVPWGVMRGDPHTAHTRPPKGLKPVGRQRGLGGGSSSLAPDSRFLVTRPADWRASLRFRSVRVAPQRPHARSADAAFPQVFPHPQVDPTVGGGTGCGLGWSPGY